MTTREQRRRDSISRSLREVTSGDFTRNFSWDFETNRKGASIRGILITS